MMIQEKSRIFIFTKIFVVLGYSAITLTIFHLFGIDLWFSFIIFGIVGWFNEKLVDPVVRILLEVHKN